MEAHCPPPPPPNRIGRLCLSPPLRKRIAVYGFVVMWQHGPNAAKIAFIWVLFDPKPQGVTHCKGLVRLWQINSLMQGLCARQLWKCWTISRG